MFYGQNRDVHPFYVKSDCNPPVQDRSTPPVQPSVALESYLEEVKLQLVELKITKPKQNLSRKERKALNELKQSTDINLKKADKGNTTVVMNKSDKIREGQIQIDDQQNYTPLARLRVVSNFGDRDCGAGEILTRARAKFRGDATRGDCRANTFPSLNFASHARARNFEETRPEGIAGPTLSRR